MEWSYICPKIDTLTDFHTHASIKKDNGLCVNHVCKACKLWAQNPSNPNTHSLNASGELLHGCEFCNKTFIVHSTNIIPATRTLNSPYHERTNDPEKQAICVDKKLHVGENDSRNIDKSEDYFRIKLAKRLKKRRIANKKLSMQLKKGLNLKKNKESRLNSTGEGIVDNSDLESEDDEELERMLDGDLGYDLLEEDTSGCIQTKKDHHSSRNKCGSLITRGSILKQILSEKPEIIAPKKQYAFSVERIETIREPQNETKKDIKMFICGICDEEFEFSHRLEEHCYIHRLTEPQFECCNKVYESEVMSRLHTFLHKLSETRMAQKKAKKRNKTNFTNNDQCNDRTKSQPENNIHCCGICDKGFDRVESLKTHLYSHRICTRNANFACGVCQAGFETMTIYKDHVATHNKKMKYFCGHCKKPFKKFRVLESHVKEKHA